MSASNQHDLGKLVLRVALGVLILLHGVAKLKGGTAGIVGMVQAHGLPGFLGYGVLVGEVLAPLMLIAGYYARFGAALVAVNMLVAVLLVHMGQIASLNKQGGWDLELQGMFFAAAIALALLGPGKYSANGQ